MTKLCQRFCRETFAFTVFHQSDEKNFGKKPEICRGFEKNFETFGERCFSSATQNAQIGGNSERLLSCSVAYDLRIVFEFIRYENNEAILLESIGTHKEVY